MDESCNLILEFQSRLRIGIVKNKQIDFYAKMSRQYLWYVRAPDFYPRVRFVSERNGLKLKHIFNAFNIPDMNRMLRNARFNRQLVVGYTSLDEGKKSYILGDLIYLT